MAWKTEKELAVSISRLRARSRRTAGFMFRATACVVTNLVVDCKVEIDCIAYKAPLSSSKRTGFFGIPH
jgi:hypothetical protein